MAYKKRDKRSGPRYIKKRRRRQTKMQEMTKTVNQLVKASKSSMKLIRKAQYQAGSILVSPYKVYNISNINGAANIFGTGSNDLHANWALWKKCNIQVQLSAEEEDDWVGCTMFIASLKNRMTDANFDSGNGALTLDSGEHYYQSEGMGYLNKDYFNIHYYKQFQFNNMGAAPSGTGNQNTLTHNLSLTLRPNKRIVNGEGDWNALNVPSTPSHNYFIIILNNNLSGDLQYPVIKYHVLNTYTSP